MTDQVTDEQPQRTDEPQTAEDAPEPTGPAGEAPPAEAATHGGADAGSGGEHVGLRLLAAVVTLPWLTLYGATGAWAVTRAARAAADGLEQLDAGYTRMVTPGGLALVGALLLAAFTVVLAAALLLLFRGRSAAWVVVLVAAAALTAGSIWAAAYGGLHPLLWLLLFFGLAYVTVLALVRVLKMTRADRRGRIEPS